VIRIYFNGKAAIWDETIAEKDTAKLSALADRMNIEPGSIVLDVGAGTGVFAPYVLSKIGKNGRLVAADLAEEMLKIAKAKHFNGNIEYLQADVTYVPLPDGVFDIVVCYSSFPHFQDKPKALSELNRILKRGGRLFICHTSGRSTINEIHSQIPAVENDVIPDRDEMHTMLLSVGFIDIGIDDESDSYFAVARKPELN
jgi:ubiquinone/menaquinone biosynthesis C-methylase UbiE